jgi:ABC-type Fe3+-hydroxamate transport system substrate-binding protein
MELGISVLDMLGREINIPENPKRIVSLVPSQTELLFDLGLDEKIVGVTWFCVHPKDRVKSKAKIGGTKNIKIDKIRELQPDLIIANKEENEREHIEELAAEFPVWVSDISTVEDAVRMIRELGTITGMPAAADKYAQTVRQEFMTLEKAPARRTLYLIWREPYMSIGNDTFIHHILSRIGLENVCGEQTRYPELDADQIKELNPELILLSSEPYPFTEKHIAELEAILPEARVKLVDGEMFSWYGSRLVKAVPYLNSFVQNF